MCVTRRIKIRFREKKRGTTHYVWNLASKGETGRKHDNLCLDSPDDDFEFLMGSYTVYRGKRFRWLLGLPRIEVFAVERPQALLPPCWVDHNSTFRRGQEDFISPDDGIPGAIWGNIGRMETIHIF